MLAIAEQYPDALLALAGLGLVALVIAHHRRSAAIHQHNLDEFDRRNRR